MIDENQGQILKFIEENELKFNKKVFRQRIITSVKTIVMVGGFAFGGIPGVVVGLVGAGSLFM